MELGGFGKDYSSNNVVLSGEANNGTGLEVMEQLVVYRHSLPAIIILVIGYLIVLFLGIVGNSIVIAIVIKTPQMRTVTNLFITNLAFADLLVLIFCLPPTLISNIYVPWILGWFLCKTVPYVQGVTVCASVYSLVAISMDRFLVIWFPLRSQITKKQAVVVVALIWTWAVLLALPWLLFFDLAHADPSRPSLEFCIEKWPEGMDGNAYFVVVNLIMFYLFPLGVISLCYFFIWFRVWRQEESEISRIALIHEKAKVAVLKMLMVVVFVFIVCWLPLYVIFTRLKMFPVDAVEQENISVAMPVAQWLGASNSCINPLLYAFFNTRFRHAFFRVFRGCPSCSCECIQGIGGEISSASKRSLPRAGRGGAGVAGGDFYFKRTTAFNARRLSRDRTKTLQVTFQQKKNVVCFDA